MRDSGNDLIVQVKGNQPKLHAAIARLAAAQSPCARHVEREPPRRGRRERREVRLFALAPDFGHDHWQGRWRLTSSRVISPHDSGIPMPTIKLEDLEQAYDFTDAARPYGGGVWLDRNTGAFWELAEDEWYPEPPPTDPQESPDYVAVPDSHELGIGVRQALAFAETRLPDHLQEIRGLFHHKGGWKQFKALIQRLHLENDWYAWRDASTREALREWATDKGIDVI